MRPVAQARARAGTGDGLTDGGRAARIAASARAMGTIVRRHRVILFVTMALCVLAGVFFILFSTPDYQATASVEVVDVPAGAAGAGNSVRAPGPTDTESLMQTQMEVLRSRALAEDVARELALIGSATFWQGMDERRPDRGAGSLTQRQVEVERVVELLQRNLDISLPGRSRVLSIGFTSADPVLSARIANSYADNLIRADLKRGFDSGVQARRFLLGELDGARRDMERAERDLAVYAARFATGTGGQDGEAVADSQALATRLAQLNGFRAQAVADRIAAQKKWESARVVSAGSLPDVLANGAMQQLMARRAEARAALVEERQFRKDAHPEMREARAQLAALDDQIDAMAQTIRDSVHIQYDVAVRGEKQIDGEIADLERAVQAGRGRDVQLGIMERQVDTYRALHDSLLQRYRDMASEAGFQSGRIQPLDRAAVPAKPTSPNIGSIMLVASIGGLLLGLLLVAARHIFDDAVTSADTLAERVDLPLLGAVPVTGQDDAVAQGAFAPIAASLLLATVDGLPRSLLVTSAQSDEGKSTSVHALAVELARLGKTVLVIDADMRRPVQHRLSRVTPVKGISEVMTGQARAEDAIVETGEANLSLLPCAAMPPNPAELLSTGAFDALLVEMQGRYDTILVDAPPILGLSDAPLIGAKVQATVLVIESGRNHHGGLRVAVDRLRRAGGLAIGAILTKQPLRSGSYDYHVGG